MESTKISIAIATYNSEKTIRYALDSILRQSYTNYEVIIVDDHSTDDTAAIILNEYCLRDKRFKLFVNTTDDNAYVDAHNKSFMYCTGDILCRMDHDDFLDEEYMYAIAQYMNNHPDVDCLSCTIDFYDYINGSLHKSPHNDEHYIQIASSENICNRFNNDDDYNCWLIISQNVFWHHNGMAIRKTTYDRIKPQYTQKELGDFIFYLNCYKSGMKFNILRADTGKHYYHAVFCQNNFSASEKFETLDAIQESCKIRADILRRYDNDYFLLTDTVKNTIEEIEKHSNKIDWWNP